MAEPTTENNCGAVKIAGYLEKKGKKKLVSTWKRYWFVLEGRLLLYYKNSETTNLCPCKGSINMGLATGVRPLTSHNQMLTGHYMFEIVSHTYNTILLRTKDRATHEQWLQALLDALGTPNVSTPVNLAHFRYSMDSLIPTQNQEANKHLRRQNTLPNQPNSVLLTRRETFMKRIRRISGYSSQSMDVIYKKPREMHPMKSSPRIPRSKNVSRMIDRSTEFVANTDTLEPDSNKKIVETNQCKLTDNENSEEYVEVENSMYSVVNQTNLTNNTNDSSNSEPSIKAHTHQSIIDENKNCCIIKAENYTEDISNISAEEKPTNTSLETKTNNQSPNVDDDVEYYYSCGEIIKTEQKTNSQESLYYEYAEVPEIITNEPSLPPRRVCSNGDEKMSDNVSTSTNESDTKTMNPLKLLKMKILKFRDKDDVYEKINKEKGTKRRFSFLRNVLHHQKKKTQVPEDDVVLEPDYEYVDYNVVKENEAKDKKDDTSLDENKKSITGGLKILSGAAMIELQNKISHHQNSKKDEEMSNNNRSIDSLNDIHVITVQAEINNHQYNIRDEIKDKPGLPPRNKTISRPRSPWHDVPSNNTPFLKPGLKREIIVSPHKYDSLQSNLKANTISEKTQNFNIVENSDQKDNRSCNPINDIKENYNAVINETISVELKSITKDDTSKINIKCEKQQDDEKDASDLSVQELINKYNSCLECINVGKTSICKIQSSRQKLNEEGVTLRREKCDNCLKYDQSKSCEKPVSKINRHSDELNKLLEELAKITNAPLLQPGVTSSLVQVRPRGVNMNTRSCGPLTDDELLAITPIRRRRHSEPDYDIPRSHRSLHISQVARKLQNEMTPTSQFFVPIIPNGDSSTRDSIEPSSTNYSTSITPDSLEPFLIDQRHGKQNHEEKDRSISNEFCPFPTLVPIQEKASEDEYYISSKAINLDNAVDKPKNKSDTEELLVNNQLISDRYYDSLEQSTVF